MAKDLSLAVAAGNDFCSLFTYCIAHRQKVSLPLGGQSLQMYNLMSSQGNGGKDFSFAYDFLRNKNEKK